MHVTRRYLSVARNGRKLAYRTSANCSVWWQRQQHTNAAAPKTIGPGAGAASHSPPASSPGPDTNKSHKKRQSRLIYLLLFGSVPLAYSAFEYSRYGFGSSNQGLNEKTFTPFRLVSKERLSSTCSIFTLEQPQLPVEVVQDTEAKGVWSVAIKQPQLQIARAYTPLPSLNDCMPQNHIRLLIRREPKGEVSNFLHNMPEDSNIELRGPAIEFQLPGKVSEVVFLAGGTGIAPALQIAHALRDQASISILWANRKREDCKGGESDTLRSPSGWLASLGAYLGRSPSSHPPVRLAEHASSHSGHAIVQQLAQMKKTTQTHLSVDYFVDEEGKFIRPTDVATTLTRRDDTRATGIDRAPGDKLVFVSGPEGFINYWAGPKVWRNGREVQGPLGGALSRMDLDGYKVVKL